MSKKKRSKILATLLCATTMAAFYASPQIGYAVSLNQKEDGTVTTDSGGTNTAIHNIEGIESITFGVQGDMETGGVNLYFDGTGTYGGLVANGSLTATDLYITVENNADGDNYNSNRYSLKNALGIHRTGTGDEAITNIEANSQGHGGMQVSSDTVSILDGAAVFTNKTTSDNGGTISFSSAFNSEQGMTVGTNFVLDSTGKISKVNGIDVQGALTTTGTINSMTIGNNQVNGVTLNNGNVTANEVTVGSYKLSEVGSLANTINQKTMGIASYDASNGTTFNGKITAYAGVVTNSISDGSASFRVSDAKDVIDAVNNSDTGLEATNDLAKKNETDIASLDTKVDTFDGRITKNTDDIGTLNTKTTGMSYDASSGTTFAQAVTANDFKIGDTSLKNVADAVNNETSGLAATHKIATDNQNVINDPTTGLKATYDIANANKQAIENADTGLAAAHTKIGAAESEIDTLQKVTTGMSYDDSTGTKFAQDVTANDFKIGNTSLNQVAQDVNNTTTGLGATYKIATDNQKDITALETKTHNISADGNSITNLTNLSTVNLTATTGTIGSVTFTGGTATGLTNIAGYSVTVAGTAISNGSFNGVTIADYNTNGSHGATINSVSIYQDSGNDYWVGDVNISKLTSGSGVTVEGIERTDNGTGGHITTIEENLAINSNGEISNHDDSFKVKADGTVTGKDFVIDSNTSLSGVAGDLDTAEGRISSNETAISGLGTKVTTAEKDITGLKNKTHGFDSTGETLELSTINSTTGTVGGVTFNGGTATGLNTIGTAADTVTVAGTAISNGSFNGVNIGVDSNSHATFNGVSIYKEANDYIVGDVNLSKLKGVSGTEIEGIERTDNTPDAADDNNFTTTIEGTLKVNTDGTFSNANESFKVDADGNVTGKDFVINGVTSLSTVAQATTGMTYTAGNTTAEGVTSFDHEVQATNVTTTTGADLNELSATVGDANSGLVQNVNALKTKTTNLSVDGSTLTGMTNIESAAGTIGGMTFATVNGMKTIGSADDTITVAGAEITSNSFNNVEIYQKDENSHYFVGDVDVSALKSGSTEITNKLRGITYSSDDETNYAMTLAGHFSVSTSGEFTFKDGTGKEYHLDDLINTVDTGDLEDFKELKDKVKDLEDKTTGISFDKESGSTTISDMTGTDTDGDGINDSFTKGDNSLTVGDDGITANGDTVINGDTDDNTTGGNGNGSNDPQGGDSIINGDQLVDGDQHVTGDSQFDGTVTVGTGTDGNGQTVINGGTINTGNTVIDGGQVKADEGHFDNITVGEGDNKTTIGDDGIKVGDNTTIDNSGVSIKDENGNVFMGDHDVVIKDSEGNVEASLSDVANRVDGIEQSIGDLNSRMGELEDRIDKVGAMAAAIANLRTMGYDPAAPTEVAVGIGQYRNETGAALGLFHYPNRDFMLSLSVSTSGDEVMGGIGATWKFGRKSPEKVAAEKAEKAREAKLQKAEAIKEAARLKKIEAQQERHAKLAAQKTATK